jgi:hypothetical protein
MKEDSDVTKRRSGDTGVEIGKKRDAERGIEVYGPKPRKSNSVAQALVLVLSMGDDGWVLDRGR